MLPTIDEQQSMLHLLTGLVADGRDASLSQLLRGLQGTAWQLPRFSVAEVEVAMESDGGIEQASLAQLRAMLNCCSRGEKFCDGYWDSKIADGTLARIRDRLHSIQANRSQTNIVDHANETIRDFVTSRDGSAFAAGTGRYSTPFRGTLFSEVSSAAVSEHLTTRTVDVLWMGSNPNVPDSLHNVLTQEHSDFNDFCDQADSGFFGECLPQSGSQYLPAWDPIHKPEQSGWKRYSRLLGEHFDMPSSAMINYIPWGSANLNQFLSCLDDQDSALLNAGLALSEELHRDIVKAMRPRLIVVPFSLGRLSALARRTGSSIFLANANEPQNHSVKLSRNFSVQVWRGDFGGHESWVLHLPHPSSLQVKRENVDRLEDFLCGVLAMLAGSNQH